MENNSDNSKNPYFPKMIIHPIKSQGIKTKLIPWIQERKMEHSFL